VNRVVPAEQCVAAALELARGLVAAAPQAMAATKRLLYAPGQRPDLRGAAAESAAVRVSDEAAEGMRAFLEKRPPRWAEGA
jgi:enoyl-CoA hydratase/carnithine racemase